MAAANDGLVGVVSIKVQAPPAENLCENVTRRGNTLSGRASDTDSEGLLHCTLSSSRAGLSTKSQRSGRGPTGLKSRFLTSSLSLRGEDSYGAGCWSSLFGGF